MPGVAVFFHDSRVFCIFKKEIVSVILQPEGFSVRSPLCEFYRREIGIAVGKTEHILLSQPDPVQRIPGIIIGSPRPFADIILHILAVKTGKAGHKLLARHFFIGCGDFPAFCLLKAAAVVEHLIPVNLLGDPVGALEEPVQVNAKLLIQGGKLCFAEFLFLCGLYFCW